MPLAQARQLVAAGKENIDLDSLAALGLPAKSFHNFRNLDGSVSITQPFTSVFGGDAITFQWDEPFDLGKVKTDYNIYVFDAAGHYLDPNDPHSPIFATRTTTPTRTNRRNSCCSRPARAHRSSPR